MKILVFLQGTVLIEKNMLANTREESVLKSREWNLKKGPLGGLVPIGRSVAKLNSWKEKGAIIQYMTASRKSENVKTSIEALKQYGFPVGELFSRGPSRSYAQVAVEIAPDIIIEDDCESIGGEKEMVYPNMKADAKSRIKSIVVKEFEGIDHLPDDPEKLAVLALFELEHTANEPNIGRQRGDLVKHCALDDDREEGPRQGH